MAFRTFFLCLIATHRHGTRDSSNPNYRDTEKGPEVLPRNDLDNIYNDDRLDEEEAQNVQEDNTEGPLEPKNPRRLSRLSSAVTLVDKPNWLQKVWRFIFPPKEELESFIPNYRHAPIVSGLFIPFSILLEIPALTAHWNVHTNDLNNQMVENRPNPSLLNVGLGFSLACALVANICLIVRFLEKRVKTMTIICIAFLAVHDFINIITTIIYSLDHPLSDGSTYGQSFWMAICSTAVSSFTIATLVWDLWRTPNFNKSGSGLTRKQRTLVIIIMILFCYICLGALINSCLQKLSFINGLYFTLVTIETIGFGDIVPETTGARVFICVYAAIGLLNLGVAIGKCRDMVLEAMDVGYRKRLRTARERWKESRKRRYTEARWRHVIESRLRTIGVPVWVRDENFSENKVGRQDRGMKWAFTKSMSCLSLLSRAVEWSGFCEHKFGHSQLIAPAGMRLNLAALTQAQLEASAIEVGAPLDMLLPSDFISAFGGTNTHNTDTNVASDSSMTRAWVQHPLTACMHTHARLSDENPDGPLANEDAFLEETSNNLQTGPSPVAKVDKGPSHLDFKSTSTHYDDSDFQTMEKMEKKRASRSKLIISWTLFFVFWFTSAAIFMATEGWSYGISVYFCFVAFTTIGYGDYTPTTPAGRSVFIVWAIVGVGTMTILISVIQQAHASKYKGSIHIAAFDKAVKRYRLKCYRRRVQYKQPVSGPCDQGHTSIRTDPSLCPQNNGSRPHPSSAHLLSQANAGDENSEKTTAELHTEALQVLLGHVLYEANRLHKCSWYYVDGGNILDIQGGSGSEAIASRVSDILSRQLDDVAVSGGIGKATREEVLQDPDARHTLFTLTIEKALYKIIDAAERAMEVVQERVPATQMQQHNMAHNEPNLEGGTTFSNPAESSTEEHSIQ